MFGSSRVPGLGLSLRAALPVALAAGVATGLAWEPYGWWPLLLLGLPAFTLVLLGARPRRAFGLGYAFGLAMLTLAVSWTHVLGWWVAALLILFESLMFGLLGVAIAVVSRLRIWPVAAAGCWVMIEFVYSRVPFGGFGWTRIAYTAVDTPLAGYLPVVGVVGLSFSVALVGSLIAWIVAAHWPTGRGPRAGRILPIGRVLLIGAGSIGLLLLGGAGMRSYHPERAGPDPETVRVGVVQGNVPGRGIEALGRMRSVTNNHLSETVDLMARARLGQVPPPDFLLWPENSTDIDPQVDAVTRSVVWSAARLAGRPILVGAVTRGPGPGERQTTAMWWDPVQGVLATYHKQNLVPFGEWIPFREQLLPLVPLLAQVGPQSVPGTEPGVLRVPVGGRTIAVGDVICFELAYDGTVYDTVTGGAQVLLVQSNNATYGGTGQVEQQFAITRARAMETRREIAVATTNSVSGFIDADGRVLQRTEEFTSASFVVTMPLRSTITPAVRLAPWLDRALAAFALVCVLVALAGRRPSDSLGSGRLAGTAIAVQPVAAGRRTGRLEETAQ